MVSQKEVLESEGIELAKLRGRLVIVEVEFKRDLASQLQAIEALEAERKVVHYKMKVNRKTVACKVSDSPELYGEGWNGGSGVKPEIKEKLALEFPSLGDKAFAVVLSQFRKAVQKLNASLEAEDTELGRRIYALECEQPYADRLAEVVKLRESVRSKSNWIANLSDIAAFRQWAKYKKGRDARDALRQQKEVEEAAAAKWVVENIFEKVE